MTQKSDNNNIKGLELLAPAGSIDALKMAVYYGADAVYMGLKNFSARANADNFDQKSLGEWIRFAHLFGVKVYIAINTLIKDCEMQEALNAIKEAYIVGADAFIIQDIGLLKKVHSIMPDITLHASTQMGIHNVLGAQKAKELGCARIILSREATLEDIRQIKQNVDIEIEYFVQGALCVGFSGNCYFSSIVSTYSGNRGRCLQLCRKNYQAQFCGNSKQGYLLSPKDLCLIDRLEQLADAGVCSIKIEGRMRRAEYTAEAVRIYRAKIEGKALSDNDLLGLKKTYNRGNFTEGYLDSANNPSIIFSGVQGHLGAYIGKVKSVCAKRAKIDCIQGTLFEGDGVKFLRGENEVGGGKFCEGAVAFSGRVLVGDDAYITTDNALLQSLSSLKKTIPIDAQIFLAAGQKPKAVLTDGQYTASYEADFVVQAAQTAPIKKEDVESSFCKTGGSVFEIKNLCLNIDGEIFLPKSKLNELRRKAFEKFEAVRLAQYNDRKPIEIANIILPKINKDAQKPQTAVILSDINQLSNQIFCKSDAIIFAPRVFDKATIKQFCDAAEQKFFLNLPPAARKEDVGLLEDIISQLKIKKLFSNNLYGAALAQKTGAQLIAGWGHNILNSFCGYESFVDSIECEKPLGGFVYSFGKFALMTLLHCPKRAICGGDCQGCNQDVKLDYKDQKGNIFEVVKHRIVNCFYHLYNSVPIYIKPQKNNILLDFSVYNKRETKELFDKILSGADLQIPFSKALRGKTLK